MLQLFSTHATMIYVRVTKKNMIVEPSIVYPTDTGLEMTIGSVVTIRVPTTKPYKL